MPDTVPNNADTEATEPDKITESDDIDQVESGCAAPPPSTGGSPMQLYIPIAGTWSRSRRDPSNDELAWYDSNSAFDKLLANQGYTRVDQNPGKDPGYWSGDVGGLLVQKLRFWKEPHTPWREGAADLRRFLYRRRVELAAGVTLIAHSHGGQVVAYALRARPLGVNGSVVPITVVTVDTPIRRDMARVYELACQNSVRWLHLYSERGWSSKFRWLGNRFGSRVLDGADLNIKIAGGHSGCLSDQEHMKQWKHIISIL